MYIYKYVYTHIDGYIGISTLATKQKTEAEKYLIVKYQQSINLRCKARGAIKLFEIPTHTRIQNVAPKQKQNRQKTFKPKCIQKVRNYH